jgi:hypothetical protein
VTAELGSKYGKDDDVEVLRSQLERNISRCADPYQSHASVNFVQKLTIPRAKHPLRACKLTRIDSLQAELDKLSKRFISDLGDIREEMRAGLERKLDVAPFEEKFRLGFGGAQVKKIRGRGRPLSKSGLVIDIQCL